MKQLIVEWEGRQSLSKELKNLISNGHRIHLVIITEYFSYSDSIKATKALIICEKLVIVTI